MLIEASKEKWGKCCDIKTPSLFVNDHIIVAYNKTNTNLAEHYDSWNRIVQTVAVSGLYRKGTRYGSIKHEPFPQCT